MSMLRLFAAAFVIGVCALFWGGVSHVVGAERITVEMPSARYDHAPAMPMKIRYETGSMFRVFCEIGLEEGLSAAACAPEVFHEEQGLCLIVIDQRFRSQQRILIRHERAHCNGWRH